MSSFSYSPGAYIYEVRTESAIRQPGDSADAEAYVRTVSFMTLRLDSLTGDSLSAHVTLDSVHAERDSVVPAPDSITPATPQFSMLIDAHGMSLDRDELPGGACAGADRGELLAVARDLLIQVPPELRVGARWSDTSTVTICRGGVGVTSGVVRSYEVLDPRRADDGTPRTRIARTTTFSMAGTRTTAYGQVIGLSGSGESRSVLELDAIAGIVRSVEREGTSEVSVTYGRRTTPFVQRVMQRVKLAGSPGPDS